MIPSTIRQKGYIISLLLFVFSASRVEPVFADTPVSGYVSGKWTAGNSPYIVENDVSVGSYDSLVIEPGVTVQLKHKVKFWVYGTLIAAGTENDSIKFTHFDDSPDSLWYGIRFSYAKNQSVFEYVRMEYAMIDGPDINNGGWIYGSSSDIMIKNSLFKNNYSSAYAFYMRYSDIYLDDVTIMDNHDFTGTTNTLFRLYKSKLLGTKLRIINNPLAAFSLNESEAYIDRSIIFRNHSSLYADHSTMNIHNCVFSENSFNLTGYFGTINMYNSIVYNNADFNPGSTNQFNISYSNIEGGYSGVGNTNNNPLFTDPAGYDFSLQPGSSCINAGNQISIDNNEDGTRNDMGAYGGNGIMLAPFAHDYGLIGIGQEREHTFKIINFRNQDFAISNTAFSDPEIFSSNISSTTVNSLDIADLIVTLVPNSSGILAETMIITSADIPSGSSASVELSADAGYWGGAVSGHWTKALSPYMIGGDISIPMGDTLIIDPGVEVIFDPSRGDANLQFKVEGSLFAEGIAEDPVTFTSANDYKTRGAWSGFWLYPYDEDISYYNSAFTMNHCIVEYATTGIETERGVNIENCTIRNNLEYGIKIEGRYHYVTGEVKDCIIEYNGKSGIYCYAYGKSGDSGSAKPLLQNNKIRYNDGGGIYTYASGSSSSCQIIGGTSSSYGSPVIENNIIENNGDFGIKAHASGSRTNCYGGISRDQRGYVTPAIQKNIIKNNQTGIIIQARSYVYSDGARVGFADVKIDRNLLLDNGDTSVLALDSAEVYITNNIIWDVPVNSIKVTAATLSADYNIINGGYFGEGNISYDPKFVNAAGGDYQLQEESVCIDAGNPDNDDDGISWEDDPDDQDPDGSRLDIGIYPFLLIPDVPHPVLPEDESTDIIPPVSLSWKKTNKANNYILEVSKTLDFAQIEITHSTSDTIYNIASLDDQTSYFWRVKAQNTVGDSDWSTVSIFTTAPPVPDVPVLVGPLQHATEVELSTTLTWNSSALAEYYQIQVSTDLGFSDIFVEDSPGNQTTFNVSGLFPLTSYYWRVRAGNVRGTSNWSNPYTFTTQAQLPHIPVPRFPENFSADIAVDTTLVWNQSLYSTHYLLQISLNDDFTHIVNEADNVTDTVLSLTGLKDYTNYFWRVKGVNEAGEGDWSAVFSFKTILLPPPAPTLSAPANMAANLDTSLIISWESTDNTENYEIQLSLKNDFSDMLIHDEQITGTSFQIRNLDHITTYFWRVRAQNDAGISEWSETYAFTTIVAPPEVPVLVSPVHQALNTNIAVKFTWNLARHASGYTFQIAVNELFTEEVFSHKLQEDTTYLKTDLDNSTQYFWRVKSQNDNGESDWSQVSAFTTKQPAVGKPVLLSPDSAAVIEATSVELSWYTVDRADEYVLQVSENSDFTSIIEDLSNTAKTNFMFTGFEFGREYFWRVRAKNEDGYGLWSNIFMFTTQKGTPGIPGLISPYHQEDDVDTNVTLIWNRAVFADSYRVQISFNQEFSDILKSQKVIDTVLPIGSLPFNTAFYWRIRGENDVYVGEWSVSNSFTTWNPYPDVPEIVSPSNGAHDVPTTVYLAWQDDNKEVTYELQLDDNHDFSSLILWNAGMGLNTIEIPDLDPHTEYFWRVRCQNSYGYSGWTEVYSFTTGDETSVDGFFTKEQYSFYMGQNYPNPCYGITYIPFSLAGEEKGTFKLTDNSGRLILVKELHHKGEQQILELFVHHLVPGAYFYQIQARKYIQIRKLIIK